ncbi:hypothetical protein KPH14_006951 [Odynerus spinipes]|uniref:Adenylate kinase n=1 Tax=Odynerus spinipes TaxID=1348599 RepID=A0AAD9RRW7_9HYME|nr:hypothetical protein KPH14_006951 [Odynerus spinipes]
MGNCFRARDPLEEILPRDSGIDASAVKLVNPPIICLIGGPGAGKTTQSKKVTDKFRLVSIIATDILRDEVHTRSVRGVVLARYMSQGRLVPADVLIELIKTKMLANLNTAKGFLLTGFPRDKDQGKLFEKQVKTPDLVIYLSARNSVLRDRVMAKAITITERRDTSYDAVKERIKAFHKATNPILRYYRKKLVVVDAENDEQTVFDDICQAMEKTLNKLAKTQDQSGGHTSRV